MANRRKFSSAFKSRVALEALKERETLAELSTRFEVSQEMISRWKGAFLKLSAGVFDKKQSFKTDGSEIKISMDGKGRATDNIWIERFWRTIKRGYVYLHPAEMSITITLKGILPTTGYRPAWLTECPEPLMLSAQKRRSITQNHRSLGTSCK